MKESVVDIHDLQEAAPFFKSRFGSFLGKVLIKWLSIDKVNKAHAHNCHLRGAEFTTALLNDPLIDIKYDLRRGAGSSARRRFRYCFEPSYRIDRRDYVDRYIRFTPSGFQSNGKRRIDQNRGHGR